MKKKIMAVMFFCLASGISAGAATYSFSLPVGGFQTSESAKKTNSDDYAQVTSVSTKNNIVDNYIRFRVMGPTGSYASDGHRYVGSVPLKIPYTIDASEGMSFKLRGHVTESSVTAVELSGTWIP